MTAFAAGLQQKFLGGIKIGRLYLGENNTLTALSGGAQTGATQLKAGINVVTVVAGSGDSCMLPAFEQSRVIIVVNLGANATTIFSNEATGVSISQGGSATAGATGVSLPANKMAIFVGAQKVSSTNYWSALIA